MAARHFKMWRTIRARPGTRLRRRRMQRMCLTRYWRNVWFLCFRLLPRSNPTGCWYLHLYIVSILHTLQHYTPYTPYTFWTFYSVHTVYIAYYALYICYHSQWSISNVEIDWIMALQPYSAILTEHQLFWGCSVMGFIHAAWELFLAMQHAHRSVVVTCGGNYGPFWFSYAASSCAQPMLMGCVCVWFHVARDCRYAPSMRQMIYGLI